MNSPALNKLHEQIARLKHQAEQFDNGHFFAKNRYMQAQPSLFDKGVFSTKSMKLVDYVIEIEEELTTLPPAEHRHAYQYALERITQQVQAVFNVMKSTSVWAKENKFTYKAKPKQHIFKQAVKKIMQSSHELYDELKQNHEFERRLVLMIEERKLKLDAANTAQASEINKEILALHARLGRCRKAISATEDKIQQVEKQQLK